MVSGPELSACIAIPHAEPRQTGDRSMAGKRRNERKFEHITTYGRRLTPTDFADGINVGAVIAFRPTDVSKDQYGVVIHRTPKTITYEHVSATNSTVTKDGLLGMPRPVPVTLVHCKKVRQRSVRMKDGEFVIDGGKVRVWDNPDGVEMLGTPEAEAILGQG